MNPIKDAYNFFKYGRVVYRSAEGNVIRKRANVDRYGIDTVKTMFNKDGNIECTLKRTAHRDDRLINTNVRKQYYDPETGLEKGKVKSKYYHKDLSSKRIVDYTKTDYDYKIITLPNGKKQYEIVFPEITEIKDNKVVTIQNNQIVDA